MLRSFARLNRARSHSIVELKAVSSLHDHKTEHTTKVHGPTFRHPLHALHVDSILCTSGSQHGSIEQLRSSERSLRGLSVIRRIKYTQTHGDRSMLETTADQFKRALFTMIRISCIPSFVHASRSRSLPVSRQTTAGSVARINQEVV